MAGVFGNPITNETLEGLPEYDGKKNLGAKDRARVAMEWINAEAKDAKALQYLWEEHIKYGSNCGGLTLVYNATGSRIEYADHKDWFGSIGPTPYPAIIENGQWGVFIHRQSEKKSSGAVLYRGTNADNQECYWMLAWQVNDSTAHNKAYTKTYTKENYSQIDWKKLEEVLDKSGFVNKNNDNKCLSYVSVGNAVRSIVRAILTLDN